jgi:manganese oxidase
MAKRLFLLIFFCAQLCAAVTRHYYITAEDVPWDYAPSHKDLIHGMPLGKDWINDTKYDKIRFFEYTDNTFKTRKPQPEWLGILGPIIRAEVGDEIVVEFLNKSKYPHSIHPHGLRYDKNSEGGAYIPAGRGASVAEGVRFTYHWFADEGSGPGPGDPSSLVWWYHPHGDEASETNAGLMGPIIITAKGKANPDATPKDVDREFVATFMIFDEMMPRETMFYHPNEMQRVNDKGRFYGINGYIFGNLPGLIIKKGEKVRWYLMGMGSEMDIHTPHWHGKTVRHGQRNTDVIELLPASMTSVDMVADNPGTWLFHCQVSDHMEAGMMAKYTIYEPETAPCPVKFEEGDFWKNPQEMSLTVRNTSSKTIKNLVLMPGFFVSPMDLQVSAVPWATNQSIAPGQTQVLKSKVPVQQADKLMGWTFFPAQITYDDGSKWLPQRNGQCFHIYWRDPGQETPPILPPLQMKMNDD